MANLLKTLTILKIIFFSSCCEMKINKVYFCDELTKKYIKFEIGNGFELLTNPDLKKSVGIELYYRNQSLKELHYLYFSNRFDLTYTNPIIHSDSLYAAIVELNLKENPEIDTIYQVSSLKINGLNFVSSAVSKKNMGYNIWIESHYFNLIDSIVLLARTTGFDKNNNLQDVQKKHFKFVKSIEFGDCSN